MVAIFMELHNTKQIIWLCVLLVFTIIYKYLFYNYIIIFLFSQVDENIDHVSFQESLLELPDT